MMIAPATSSTPSHGSMTPTATPSHVANPTRAFQPATTPLQKSSGVGSGATASVTRSTVIVEKSTWSTRQSRCWVRLSSSACLVVSSDSIAMRSAIEVAVPRSSRRRSTDAVSASMRASRSWRCCVTSDAFIDTEFTVPSSRNRSTNPSSSSEGMRRVSDALGGCESVPGDSVRLSTRPPACSARSRRLLGRGHRVLDGDRDPAGRDDAAIGELRIGGTARGILGDRSIGLPGFGRDLARGHVDRGHARVGRAAHRAAGEEQCGDRGRCRRGCESSHALTVLPRGNPMSGARLGVRSRSDCASL